MGQSFLAIAIESFEIESFGVTEFNQFNPDDTISGNHGNSGYGR